MDDDADVAAPAAEPAAGGRRVRVRVKAPDFVADDGSAEDGEEEDSGLEDDAGRDDEEEVSDFEQEFRAEVAEAKAEVAGAAPRARRARNPAAAGACAHTLARRTRSAAALTWARTRRQEGWRRRRGEAACQEGCEAEERGALRRARAPRARLAVRPGVPPGRLRRFGG